MSSCYQQAVVASVLTVGALGVCLVASPRSAATIVQEHGVVEWAQVALFGAAALTALAATRGWPTPPDLFLAGLFAAFIEAELDIDRWVFGRPVIDRKFFMDGHSTLAQRGLAVVTLAALVIAVGVYTWRRRAEIIPAARALLVHPCGRLLILAVAVLLGVEVSERQLARALPLPKYFVEESLELLAALYCSIAMANRAWHARRRSLE